jgi:creatinine amidohydrolase/Fe(II)-dependent formamide hydrolase-like protein
MKTITTIDYLCTKAIGRKLARQAISALLALFSIADVNRKTLVAAIESDFSDFEAHANENETKNYKNLAIEDIQMMTLTIPDEIEEQLKKVAKINQVTPSEFVLALLQNAVNKQLIDKNESDDEALLIHEQLMEQYTEAFQKLAQ